MSLRWEKQPNGGWFAFSGEIIVGLVVERFDHQIGWDATSAVQMKWTAKGRGVVKTVASGKRAVERAWSAWLSRAGLA
jgi:hypothetical protein